jgi:hypothetical protein
MAMARARQGADGQVGRGSRKGDGAHGRVARQAEGEDVVLQQVEDGRERPARSVAVNDEEHRLASLALPRLSSRHGVVVVQHRRDEVSAEGGKQPSDHRAAPCDAQADAGLLPVIGVAVAQAVAVARKDLGQLVVVVAVVGVAAGVAAVQIGHLESPPVPTAPPGALPFSLAPVFFLPPTALTANGAFGFPSLREKKPSVKCLAILPSAQMACARLAHRALSPSLSRPGSRPLVALAASSS